MKQRVRVLLLLALIAAAAASVMAWRAKISPPGRPEVSHHSPPSGRALAGAFRFVAFGDAGTGDGDQLAIALRLATYHDERPYNTVLMLGDNIYPLGNPADLKDKFEKPYAELLRRGVKFHAVLGNHDVYKGRTAQINYPLFNMGRSAYYSFTKLDGLIEFFALDSTKVDRMQMSWVESALAASKAQWKIAYFHHPIYSSGKRHGSDTKLRAMVEPLFVKYGVAAALSGHDHIYERTKPQQGVQYFVAGAGGKLRRGNIDRRSPIFAAGNDEVNSFMYFEASPGKLSFWAVDAAGNILDSGALTKARAATQAQ